MTGGMILLIQCYTWENFKVWQSEKKNKIKIEPEPKLCKIIKLFTSVNSMEHVLIRLKVNFGLKHQLLCYDYHSYGFL